MKELKIIKLLKKLIFKQKITAEESTISQITSPEETITSVNNQVHSVNSNPNYDTIDKIQTLANNLHSEDQEKLKNIILLIDTIYLEESFAENIKYLEEINDQISKITTNFNPQNKEQIETKITEKYQEAIQESILNKDFEEKVLRKIPAKYIINIFMKNSSTEITDPYKIVAKKVEEEHTKMKVLGHFWYEPRFLDIETRFLYDKINLWK